jgi:hypothetical protein
MDGQHHLKSETKEPDVEDSILIGAFDDDMISFRHRRRRPAPRRRCIPAAAARGQQVMDTSGWKRIDPNNQVGAQIRMPLCGNSWTPCCCAIPGLKCRGAKVIRGIAGYDQADALAAEGGRI